MKAMQLGGQVAVHVTREDLALYVMDALDASSKDRVEAHVFGCGACAEALTREASFEAALAYVAARHDEVPMVRHVDARRQRARRAWQHRAAGGVAGALAAAAAIVLALATNSTRGEPSGAVARGASLDAEPTRSAGVIGEPDYEVALESPDALDGG